MAALPGKIQKLDEVVVNRIAAGEVIQRPANALKELIENSLDAKSSNIQVTIKEGGLKLLQIQDNGTGIRKDDLDIVCERFTTSKLQNFDDLKSITTFGFRGEALASITHVAQMTITTKTADEICGYKASYVDGKLKAPPTTCAGNQGTTITVENLFYNVPTRKKVLSNISEEAAKITDVVTNYAIHNAACGFMLKRQGESSLPLRTPHMSTKINNIRTLFGPAIAKEILDISVEDTTYKFKMHALVTNANYSAKRLTLLLFINNRLVDSSSIRKTIDDLYCVYLPKKSHPWCYISLEIDPKNVDVNVHPTKHEVRFLHEESIIEKMKITIDEKLLESGTSRTFYVHAKLPAVALTKEAIEEVIPKTQANSDKTKKIQPKSMIRIDASDQKLDKFNFVKESINKSKGPDIAENITKCNEDSPSLSDLIDVLDRTKSTDSEDQPNPSQSSIDKENENTQEKPETNKLKLKKPSQKEKLKYAVDESPEKIVPTFKSYSVNDVKAETKLLSVLNLRKEVEDDYHEGLREILTNLIFVGCVDEHSALIQSGLNLYICDTNKLVEELFYEIMLYDFANYGVLKFSESLSLYELALLGLDCEEAAWTESDGKKEDLASRVQELLLEKADMLRQYFSLVIDKKGFLKSLPVLLKDYTPNLAELPLYILRLSTEVDWSKEKPCFRDVCRETARFYSRIDSAEESWKHVTEHILYIAIKESLLPPKHFSHDSTILQIASLPDLYKVFERC